MLWTKHKERQCRGSAEAERDYSELQQKQLNSVSVAVCHCHQDLLDVVDVNIGLY